MTDIFWFMLFLFLGGVLIGFGIGVAIGYAVFRWLSGQ